MKRLVFLLVLVFAAGLGGKANAVEHPHVQYRTPRGLIHCYITALDSDQDYKPNSWTGSVVCSTRAMQRRRQEIKVAERYRSYTYHYRSDVGPAARTYGGTTLRAGRTYRFKYPWRTGRTMFWVTVRRTATVESFHVRNPEGHGFLIRVTSGRTTLVRF